MTASPTPPRPIGRGEAGLYPFEVDTQPVMTPLGLVPEQARHVGMSYAQLVRRIVEDAMAETRA